MNQVALKKEIECLRGHLNQALDEILQRFGEKPGAVAPGKPPKRETKKEILAKYDKLLTTGARAKKPDYLKKK